MKCPNILLTIPNFKSAGSQFVVINLYKGLKNLDFNVKVLVNDEQGYFPNEIEKADRLCIGNLNEVMNWNAVKHTFKLAKILKINKIDIVHSWDYRSQYWEVFACKLTRTKYLFTKKNSAWSNAWLKKSRWATHIVYDQPRMKEDFFNEDSFQGKTTFIPHGIDLAKFDFRPKENLGKKFKVGIIGVIDYNKNQIIVLEALNKLDSSYELHLYGKENKAHKENLISYSKENNLEKRVFFHGFVANDQLQNVIYEMDVIILPSFKEGLPVTLLEAMATGTHCMASHSGGGTDFILENGKHGLLFAPKDSSAVAEGIEDVRKNYSIKYNALKDARQRVESNFTISSEVGAYKELYEKL